MVVKTKLVGILNLTPDSFSDGGKYNCPDSSLKQVIKLIANGADVIDIGAESTRPKAITISPEEEWLRLQNVLPEIIQLVRKKYPKVEISLDSKNYQTIAQALGLGIDIVNDVTGLADQKITNLLLKTDKKVVVTHNLGAPVDPSKTLPQDLDVVGFLIDWMNAKLTNLLNLGMAREQIIFDPGIGFGKTAEQSIKIIQEIKRLKVLGLPLFIGHSRKSFLDYFTIPGQHNADREQKTQFISKFLIAGNIDYIRVHELSTSKTYF